jgi:hypothetical protein
VIQINAVFGGGYYRGQRKLLLASWVWVRLNIITASGAVTSNGGLNAALETPNHFCRIGITIFSISGYAQSTFVG